MILFIYLLLPQFRSNLTTLCRFQFYHFFNDCINFMARDESTIISFLVREFLPLPFESVTLHAQLRIFSLSSFISEQKTNITHSFCSILMIGGANIRHNMSFHCQTVLQASLTQTQLRPVYNVDRDWHVIQHECAQVIDRPPFRCQSYIAVLSQTSSTLLVIFSRQFYEEWQLAHLAMTFPEWRMDVWCRLWQRRINVFRDDSIGLLSQDFLLHSASNIA